MADILNYSNSRDYTANKEAAMALALSIKEWWHSRGHSKVDVWVDTIPVYGVNGDRITVRYDIRSNIYTDTAQISQANTVA